MIGPEIIERPFPGMEGMPTCTEIEQKKAAANELNEVFDSVTWELARIADRELLGAIEDIEGIPYRLVAFDVANGLDTVALWDLHNRGGTQNKGVIYLNTSNQVDKIDVEAYQVKLRGNLYPGKEKYDQRGNSISIARIFEQIHEAVAAIGETRPQPMNPMEAVQLLKEVESNNISFPYPSSNL